MNPFEPQVPRIFYPRSFPFRLTFRPLPEQQKLATGKKTKYVARTAAEAAIVLLGRFAEMDYSTSSRHGYFGGFSPGR